MHAKFPDCPRCIYPFPSVSPDAAALPSASHDLTPTMRVSRLNSETALHDNLTVHRGNQRGIEMKRQFLKPTPYNSTAATAALQAFSAMRGRVGHCDVEATGWAGPKEKRRSHTAERPGPISRSACSRRTSARTVPSVTNGVEACSWGPTLSHKFCCSERHTKLVGRSWSGLLEPRSGGGTITRTRRRITTTTHKTTHANTTNTTHNTQHTHTHHKNHKNHKNHSHSNNNNNTVWPLCRSGGNSVAITPSGYGVRRSGSLDYSGSDFFGGCLVKLSASPGSHWVWEETPPCTVIANKNNNGVLRHGCRVMADGADVAQPTKLLDLVKMLVL